MNMIDIEISKICQHCGTKTPLRYHGNCIATLTDHARMAMQIDPDEFEPCQECGRPLSLQIQAMPYDLARHVDDAPVSRFLNS